MAERMTGLSVERLFDNDHNSPRIPEFIGSFARALYAGDGKKPTALQYLSIEPDFPLRLLLGIPAKELTRKQRLLAESFCAMFFGRHLGDTTGLWTNKPCWRPINPNRVSAPVEDSVLDTEWMMTLGISKSIWESQVLMTPITIDRRQPVKTDGVIRQVLMLSVYGFADPYQFFTKRGA